MSKQEVPKIPSRIYFVTTNAKKVLTLREIFSKAGLAVELEHVVLDIAEPQCSCVREVSRQKAEKAYAQIKAPLVVEDGGFEIPALKGFPGVYTKYILDTIGVDGILKLMEGRADRACCFASTASYVDACGSIHQFDRLGGWGEIALERSSVQSPYAWSDFWSIYRASKTNKYLCEMNQEELMALWCAPDQKTSLEVFAAWLSGGTTR